LQYNLRMVKSARHDNLSQRSESALRMKEVTRTSRQQSESGCDLTALWRITERQVVAVDIQYCST